MKQAAWYGLSVVQEGLSENETLELGHGMRKESVTSGQTEVREISTKTLEWESFSFQGQKDQQCDWRKGSVGVYSQISQDLEGYFNPTILLSVYLHDKTTTLI